MELTAAQIAQLVQGRVHGDEKAVLRGVAGLDEASPADLSFLRDAKNAKALKQFAATRAGAVIIPTGVEKNGRTVIEVDNPTAAFARILEVVAKEKRPTATGIHPLAHVAKNAKIGKSASIGPFCTVEDGAEIADGATLLAQVYVGPRAKIGPDTYVYPQAVIREDVQVGARCIIHAGAVLGADGFGYFFAGGRHNKIPQVGNVVVEDDVEIGSCTTIDRATTGSTFIRKGAKIDNLVQVAHNVDVGPHSILVAQVGIAGSSKLGAGVVLAGQVGVADHVTIGAGAQVGAQSGIKSDVAPGAVLFGTPAQPVQDTIRQSLLLRKLPELFKDVKKLKESGEHHD